LDQGLTSKKPKIVQMAASLILEAAYSFGAACLPIAAISQSLPKMLSHSNKKIRDTGMEIVAEFCRALGSKAPMNDVIEKMKKAQVKDLDALLAKKPGPTPVKIGLRSQKASGGGENAASSPEDALAALQAGAKELEAERFVRRPAVNLMEAIKTTDYAAKLKLAKWSEKVAGLNMIIESGGEKPYKLVQPSHSANYSSLISEMKGILSHTHFAVVNKTMEVLSMLAQGVGEKLYSNLRPLLPKLFSLSKDKKLTNGVSACLDSFFGNVVGFEHLLDPADSAIPEAVDEHKEKNALARTTALDFLGRCVTRGESAGPRGIMAPARAKACAELCSKKLGDGDANVRKAALNALKALQNLEDPHVCTVVDAIIEELKDTHPRVYKSLGGGAKKAAPSSMSASAPPAKTKHEETAKSAARSSESRKPGRPAAPKATPAPRAPPVPKHANEPRSRPAAPSQSAETESGHVPDLDEATSRCASLGIPLWEAADEDGGIVAGLECKCREKVAKLVPRDDSPVGAHFSFPLS
jgi:cytoskeleton-associated protein 5